LLNDLFGFIFSGNIGGIPTLFIMVIPFIIGLIIGFLIKKFLKLIILITIIIVIASYLGFFTLNLSSLKNIAETYGPQVIHYGTILIGILPIGIGFLTGLIIGFLFG
jgi:uncharacterized membrane protein (Fun14 family)